MLTLLRPLVNEKSMSLTKLGFYTFEVSKGTNKAEIGKLIGQKFNVHVLSVKMLNVKGKQKSQPSRKGFYTTSGLKKAIVKLKKGEKIALFEVAEKDQETPEVEVRTAEGEPMTKVKEKKSLLRNTKVRIEKEDSKAHPTGKMHTQSGGKTKGEK